MTAKDETCRRLNSNDAKELHQFASAFCRYMRSGTDAGSNPTVKRLLSKLGRGIKSDGLPA